MKKLKILSLGVIIVASIFNNSLKAQTIIGYVINEKNEPLPFVNVTWQNAQDSIFIAGGVTDGNGYYLLKGYKGREALVQFKYLGYQVYTKRVLVKDTVNLDTIKLSPDIKLLSELVITGTKQLFKMNNQGITAEIKDSQLSKLNAAADVLGQIPFVNVANNQIKVLSRGEPVIYINNKKIQDIYELKQLKASMIKSINVIMNPDAEYGSETQSVIKIITLRPADEGVSGYVYSSISKKSNFNNYESISMNYRIKNVDIFLFSSYDESNSKEIQHDNTILSFQNSTISVQDNGTIRYKDKRFTISPGFNYIVNKRHSVGLKYTYTDNFYSPSILEFNMKPYKDDVIQDAFLMHQNTSSTSHRHYLNSYYEGQLCKNLNIRVLGDYIQGLSDRSDNTNIIYQSDSKEENIPSTTSSYYKMLAGNIILEAPLFKGKLVFGTELLKTSNNQNYQVVSNNYADILSSSLNRSTQIVQAGHASWQRNWNSISFSSGLRFEHINYAFFINGVKQRVQSKIYNELFPMFTIMYNKGKIGISINYRNKIRRPSYNYLRSTISFNSPFMLESGNPNLLPARSNNLNLLISWKDFKASTDYIQTNNGIVNTVSLLEGKDVAIFKPENFNSTNYALTLSYSPRFFTLWNPIFSLTTGHQSLNALNTNYDGMLYDFSWQNMIVVKKDFSIRLNVEGNADNQSGLRKRKASWLMNFMLDKSFLDNKWEFSIGVTDIFNTSHTNWYMQSPGVKLYKYNRGDTQGAYLTATYNFKTAKSKYKGKSVNQSEINRL